MIEMTIEEFHAALKEQEVERVDLAFICPMCDSIQSARDLIRAGAGATFEEVENVIGFSCVGRWTKAGSPRKVPDGNPCNWTLGGLLTLHKLIVITPDGKRHPHFKPATPSQAKTHAARQEVAA